MFAYALVTACALLANPVSTQSAQVTTLPAQHLTLMNALAYPRLSASVWNAQPAVIEVQVNDQGRVQRARVQSTSGSLDLDRSALAAVRRATFHGAEAGSRVRVPVKFQLNDRTLASR